MAVLPDLIVWGFRWKPGVPSGNQCQHPPRAPCHCLRGLTKPSGTMPLRASRTSKASALRTTPSCLPHSFRLRWASSTCFLLDQSDWTDKMKLRSCSAISAAKVYNWCTRKTPQMQKLGCSPGHHGCHTPCSYLFPCMLCWSIGCLQSLVSPTEAAQVIQAVLPFRGIKPEGLRQLKHGSPKCRCIISLLLALVCMLPSMNSLRF